MLALQFPRPRCVRAYHAGGELANRNHHPYHRLPVVGYCGIRAGSERLTIPVMAGVSTQRDL